jgi:hypothetical protein
VLHCASGNPADILAGMAGRTKVRPGRKSKGDEMTHELIKRGAKDYYCTKCDQQWTFESKAHCPNMQVIAYRDRGPLMSKTELDKRGYKTDALPHATCCYRMNDANNNVLYVKLYEPSQCALKKTRKHKVLHYIDSLHWPKSWGTILETVQQWDSEHKRGEHIRAWRQICLDTARLVSPLLAFTPDEITALGGEAIEFKFPLIPVRTEWPDRDVSFKQAQDLIDLLLSRYSDWKWQNRPPLTEAEMEARRIKQEERNRRGLQIVNQELKERYALPDWVTAPNDQPPAKQQSLF